MGPDLTCRMLSLLQPETLSTSDASSLSLWPSLEYTGEYASECSDDAGECAGPGLSLKLERESGENELIDSGELPLKVDG